jgi:hypothetical protein
MHMAVASESARWGAPCLPIPRHPTVTLLPDGTFLVSGGTARATQGSANVEFNEIWNPEAAASNDTGNATLALEADADYLAARKPVRGKGWVLNHTESGIVFEVF